MRGVDRGDDQVRALDGSSSAHTNGAAALDDDLVDLHADLDRDAERARALLERLGEAIDAALAREDAVRVLDVRDDRERRRRVEGRGAVVRGVAREELAQARVDEEGLDRLPQRAHAVDLRDLEERAGP